MALNDRFRAHFIQVQTQKALDNMDSLAYLRGALNSEPLAKAISELRGRRHDRRFEDMLHRDDDPMRWIAYIKHEQAREKSDWNAPNLKATPDRIKEWFCSLGSVYTGPHQDLVVDRVNKELEEIQQKPLIDSERKRVGLWAFRTILSRLWREGDDG